MTIFCNGHNSVLFSPIQRLTSPMGINEDISAISVLFQCYLSAHVSMKVVCFQLSKVVLQWFVHVCSSPLRRCDISKAKSTTWHSLLIDGEWPLATRQSSVTSPQWAKKCCYPGSFLLVRLFRHSTSPQIDDKQDLPVLSLLDNSSEPRLKVTSTFSKSKH
jgi:hypothetical protein